MSSVRDLRNVVLKSIKEPVEPLEILISKALNDLAEEVGLGNLALSQDLEKELVRVTNNAQIKWTRVSKKLDFYCTSCGSKLIPSTCGKFDCRTCDELMMIPARKLNAICYSCPAFQKECPGNLDHDYENVLIKNKKTRKALPTWVLDSAVDPE